MQSTRSFKLSRYRSSVSVLVLALLAPSALLLHAAKTETPTEALARGRQTTVFRVGYYADAGPFSYQDEAGQPAGYAVALCQAIANDLKSELGLSSLDVQFVLVTGEDR